MLRIIRRDPAYVSGYRDYCQEFYDAGVTWFRPTDPSLIDDGWFERTADWYARKEQGLLPGHPAGINYWAVDGARFIGEFQLRTEFTEKVMTDIGSIGYSVRISEQGKGYGQQILSQGLDIARGYGMERVLLTINDANAVSAHICEKLGGVLMDRIPAYNKLEGNHIMRRYWIYL